LKYAFAPFLSLFRQIVNDFLNKGDLMLKPDMELSKRYTNLALVVFALFSHTVEAADSKCTFEKFRGIDKLDATIVKTVDGDTAKISYKRQTYNVRFLSIDTPETNFQGKSQGVWAERAKRKLEEILRPGNSVMVEFGEEKCDRYGRILGHVWKDGKDVNLTMLQEGLAVNYCIAPNLSHCQEYADVVAETFSKKKGMFADSTLELPYEWRRKMDNRPYDKFVGSIKSKVVYAPTQIRRIPVPERVFFITRDAIKAPYRLRGTR
jgi:endonuclease YncB( thermonuclease family)